ncbi:unnamed protein product, partial [Nesidiocoris tenuis]
MPREATSAGLSKEDTCRQLQGDVNSIIFVTLLATKTFRLHGRVLIHASVTE